MYASASTIPAFNFRGMGAASPTVNLGTQAASTALSAAGGAMLALHAISASTAGLTFGLSEVALAVFQLLSNVFGLGEGCGPTCVEATAVVNRLEPYLQQALNNYMASGHTQSQQAAYLQFFDATWSAVQQGCGAGPLAGTTAGRKCVSDRQSGACVWKSALFGWTQANGRWTFVPSSAAGSGSQCWNWVDYYRGSVANDPTVVPDPSPIADAGQILSSLAPSVSSIPTPLLIAGGLLVAALVLPKVL